MFDNCVVRPPELRPSLQVGDEFEQVALGIFGREFLIAFEHRLRIRLEERSCRVELELVGVEVGSPLGADGLIVESEHAGQHETLEALGMCRGSLDCDGRPGVVTEEVGTLEAESVQKLDDRLTVVSHERLIRQRV